MSSCLISFKQVKRIRKVFEHNSCAKKIVGIILKTQKDLKSRQTKQLLYLPGIKDHLTYEEAAELIHNEAKLFAGTDNLRFLK